MRTLFSLWNSIQQYLIPHIEENLGVLSKKETEFVRVAEFAATDKHLKPYMWAGNGRKPASRKAIALAFIAKAVWNLQTTRTLIEFLKANRNLRCLCGWENIGNIPSESTFSRAFEAFSKGKLPSLIHEAIIRGHMKDKLVCHISKDSTAIEAREKPVKKQKGKQPGLRRGRPGKGEIRPEKQKKRLDLQAWRSLKENLSDLPSHCDRGVKQNSRGGRKIWTGHKLHLGVSDGDIPISAILTSASVHDSQAAIPLMQMSGERVTHLYDLADSAYDAKQIKAYSHSSGRVPIIASNKRRGESTPMEPAQAIRFRERSSAERVNSNLKDNYGGRFVRVRGAAKVMAHLMFGIIALTANQLFHLLE